jgi:hypothetical protein
LIALASLPPYLARSSRSPIVISFMQSHQQRIGRRGAASNGFALQGPIPAWD